MASVGAIRCSRVDDVVHLRAVADDALEAEPLVQPAVQLGVRPPQILAAGRVLDHRPQLLQIERLEQIIERPALHRLDGRLDRAVAGDENHLGIRLQFLALGQHFEPADVRHLQVGDHDFERARLEQRDRLLAAAGHGASEADAPQTVGHRLGMRGVVVDHEHLDRRSGAGGGRRLRRHEPMIRPMPKRRKGRRAAVRTESAVRACSSLARPPIRAGTGSSIVNLRAAADFALTPIRPPWPR